MPFAAPGSGRTWRNETARITASDPLVYPGIQVALGRNADHVLTKWEESFLPDLLANHLAALTVTDANGAPVKLVVRDSVLFTADRAPMPEVAPSRVPMALALGVVLAVLVVLLSGAGSVLARGVLVAFSVLWFGVGGLIGTALLLAGAVTMIFFTYAFVNMGMVSGILPVVGVPLPFISYGGTAMVTLGLALGILMSIAKSKQLVQT